MLALTGYLVLPGGALDHAAPPREATPAPQVEPPPPEPTTTSPTPEAPPTTQAPPPPLTVPKTGSGEMRVATFTRGAPAQGGRLIRIRVAVEKDIPLDPEQFARTAADVLQDPRSWGSRGEGRFEFVGTGRADVELRLLTPDTTDKKCYPLKTFGQVSCQQGDGVNLNGVRWADAVPDFHGDVDAYRRYLVNHEVGHFLGHQHEQCPGRGKPAPVMMQQTKGTQGCTPNSWPLRGYAP